MAENNYTRWPRCWPARTLETRRRQTFGGQPCRGERLTMRRKLCRQGLARRRPSRWDELLHFDVDPAIGREHERRFAYAGGRIFYLEFSGASCSLPRVVFGPRRMPPAAPCSWRQEAGRIPRLRDVMFHVLSDARLPSLFPRPFITHCVCLFNMLRVI